MKYAKNTDVHKIETLVEDKKKFENSVQSIDLHRLKAPVFSRKKCENQVFSASSFQVFSAIISGINTLILITIECILQCFKKFTLYNLPNQPAPEDAMNEFVRILRHQFEKALPNAASVRVACELTRNKAFILGTLQSKAMLPKWYRHKNAQDPCPHFVHFLRSIRAEYCCFSDPVNGTFLEFKVYRENLVFDL